MKDLFTQYEERSLKELQTAWKHGLFIFDTNILLNLYRYQESTRDEFLHLLEKISPRAWIPYHVALEFYRNRLNVIADQNKRLFEVTAVINNAKRVFLNELEKLQLNKKHSPINPKPLKDGFDSLVEIFLADVSLQQGKQSNISKNDHIKEKLDEIFLNKVGSPPVDQADIDRLNTEADQRYKFKIPPGYLDIKKENGGQDDFIHNGLMYKRKYGDYIIWNQIIKHAAEQNIKHIVFVTSDEKEDWWWQIENAGQKTIGPRPELIEEIKIKGGVEIFLMYKPDVFLKYAKESLKTNISEETLAEVRDSSFIERYIELASLYHDEKNYQKVRKWVIMQFGKVTETSEEFPHLEITDANSNQALQILIGRSHRLLSENIITTINNFDLPKNQEKYNGIIIIAGTEHPVESELLREYLIQLPLQKKPPNHKIIIGSIAHNQSDIENTFIPHFEVILGQGCTSLTPYI